MLRPAPSGIAQGGERAGADSAVLQCSAAQLLQAAGRRSCCRLVDGSLSNKVGLDLYSPSWSSSAGPVVSEFMQEPVPC